MTIAAVSNWPTNGALIADVAALHLQETQTVLDATYGRGKWWTYWQPPTLVTNDLDPSTDAQHHHDFRLLPFPDASFDAVAFDPPYKLNGTPALGDFDARYGIGQITRWQDRVQAVVDGARECARCVTAGGTLLVKCQDQVVSGKVRWVTHMVTDAISDLGGRLVDRFDMIGGGRPQPKGRRQVHAHGRGSTLLVFR